MRICSNPLFFLEIRVYCLRNAAGTPGTLFRRYPRKKLEDGHCCSCLCLFLFLLGNAFVSLCEGHWPFSSLWRGEEGTGRTPPAFPSGQDSSSEEKGRMERGPAQAAFAVSCREKGLLPARKGVWTGNPFGPVLKFFSVFSLRYQCYAHWYSLRLLPLFPEENRILSP